MTRDEIGELAKEAGFGPNSSYTVLPMVDYATHTVSMYLERFAALGAAQEREACARLCEDLVLAHPGRADLTAEQCAAAIRAIEV